MRLELTNLLGQPGEAHSAAGTFVVEGAGGTSRSPCMAPVQSLAQPRENCSHSLTSGNGRREVEWGGRPATVGQPGLAGWGVSLRAATRPFGKTLG